MSRVTCPATDDGHGHDDMEFGVLTSNAMLYALCAMQSSLSDAYQGEDSSQTEEDGWNPCGEERRENP